MTQEHNKLEQCNCKHPPTTLEIFATYDKHDICQGYYLRHPDKGMIFWCRDGDTMVEHLLNHYSGSLVKVYCDFDAGVYGRVQGSFDEPMTLEWHPNVVD